MPTKLTPTRWQRLRAILDPALDLPPEQRAAFLEHICGDDAELRREVEMLLAAESRAGALLETPVNEFAGALLAEMAQAEAGPEELVGRRLGAYRLLREIGRGGMGAVYLAERADGEFERQVAVKLLRRGLDTDDILLRFRSERQILASLNHPNIAHLLDGGVAEDGRPFLVMEYVAGEAIDAYCDAHRLTIDQRLALFLRVAEAVQYAHRKLIVHRDLKPSNILVTEAGELKLLDFGIAKLLDPQAAPDTPSPTRTGVRPMTPEYASPEQVRGEPVTTGSDVYQLGLLLYELLTGRRLHRLEDRSPAAIERVICGEEPLLPSVAVTHSVEVETRAEATPGAPVAVASARRSTPEQLRKRLRGDLDMIVLEALRKEPERRYPSAEAMAEDIRRHLAGLPVSARREGAGYRARRFVRRHRWGVAAAAGVALLLMGYAATITVQARVIAHERDRAETEALKARRVVDILVGVFEGSDPRRREAGDVSLRTILDAGTARIATDLVDEPGVQAELLAVVGRVYASLGAYAQADSLLSRALVQHRRVHGDEHPAVAEDMFHLALAHWKKGENEPADSLLRGALAIRRRLFGPEHRAVAETMNALASVRWSMDDYEEAEPLFRAALAMRRRLLGDEHVEVAESLNDLGLLLKEKGDYAGAEPLLREALELSRKLRGEEHPAVAINLTNLGWLLRMKGDYTAAEPLLRGALAANQRIWGEEHPDVAVSMSNLAMLLKSKGQLDEAKPLLQRTLEINRKALGEEHPTVAINLYNLATLLHDEGDYAAAEPLYRRVIAIDSKVYGSDHPEVSVDQVRLALLLRDKGDHARAEPLYRSALANLRQKLPAEHPRIGEAVLGLGGLLTSRGRPAEAEPLLREGLRIRQQTLGDDHWQVAQAESLLGACLAARGAYAEAEPLLQKSYAALVERRGANDRYTLPAIRNLIALYEAWGKPARAAEYRALMQRSPVR